MKVRKAKIKDVKDICSLISAYAELDRMLYRSMADIYDDLQSFTVVEDESKVVGCCSLQIFWCDLAEIKSLAVEKSNVNKGAGKLLLQSSIDQSKALGLERVFALTLEPEFFIKSGFEVIEKDKLPMKVWSDCARCPKQQNCDETAVIKHLED